MIALGIALHAVGGFAAGTFYLPLKQVKNWGWESGWLVNGLFSWLFMPWLVALCVTPDLMGILASAPAASRGWCFLFGLLWGIGGLTFGLSMRYLGMSLGYALALGFCAAFGTLLPPIYDGEFGPLLQSVSGWTTLSGVLICLAGIGVCGWAGKRKEDELTREEKRATIPEFNFGKGVLVALFAGVMSACMAFGFAAGDPIAKLAVARGVPVLWQNSPVLIIILAGGLTTNVVWCLILNWRNRTAGDYLKYREAPLLRNYLFSSLAGITWYLQFMFYGMGTTNMGRYGFSSWTLHMAFIIAFSNLWGLRLHEWKGASRQTVRIVLIGILIVTLSTFVIGAGNYLSVIDP